MFELVERNRRASGRKAMTVVLSVVIHVVVILTLIVVPLLYATSDLPTPKDVVNAFVASAPPTPPPPPPPPPPAAPQQPKPVATTGQQNLAPIEAPPKVAPEVAPPPTSSATQGVPGGVPGGIAGGVTGGVVGGIPDQPAGGEGQGPVRVGGQIKAPDLQHRVDPKYPDIARNAHAGGIVVLEATVDPSGHVQSVRVLRGQPLLNDAAIDAVKQWRYSPLMLNGKATPFILTVTVTFQLQ